MCVSSYAVSLLRRNIPDNSTADEIEVLLERVQLLVHRVVEVVLHIVLV